VFDGLETDGWRRLRSCGESAGALDGRLETTVALSHMIFDGFLDRFPSLKILAAHGGGLGSRGVDDLECIKPSEIPIGGADAGSVLYR